MHLPEFNGYFIKAFGHTTPALFLFYMNHNWYAVITARVLLSKDLTSTQKLLVALISNLCNERGYCFASNDYLAECLGISETTVSHNLSELVNKKWIGRIIHFRENKQVDFRALTIIEPDPLPPKTDIGISENGNTPPSENRKENNKVFNNKYNNPSDDENLQTHDAEETILKSQIRYEQLLMNRKIDFTRGGEILRKYHLHLIEKDCYPMKRKQIFAGFEKWLSNEKNFTNGTHQQINTGGVKVKLGTSEARTEGLKNWKIGGGD